MTSQLKLWRHTNDAITTRNEIIYHHVEPLHSSFLEAQLCFFFLHDNRYQRQNNRIFCHLHKVESFLVPPYSTLRFLIFTGCGNSSCLKNKQIVSTNILWKGWYCDNCKAPYPPLLWCFVYILFIFFTKCKGKIKILFSWFRRLFCCGPEMWQTVESHRFQWGAGINPCCRLNELMAVVVPSIKDDFERMLGVEQEFTPRRAETWQSRFHPRHKTPKYEHVKTPHCFLEIHVACSVCMCDKVCVPKRSCRRVPVNPNMDKSKWW